eukprot:CAMPEP_0178844020 /NCGR_PEP_ID=MMETSP0746-20121128/16527_1 /TAXON_ID=913974 /ORGANISM="Nitzschia punctata, Strain CCMP561" /LENGTH=66 /DNA_ID=CAMNT_0020507813 /DNA_START=158 /DNA_END=359 /DNA_ORIENTATION=-
MGTLSADGASVAMQFPSWQQQLAPALQVQVWVVPAAWVQQAQGPAQQPQQRQPPGQSLHPQGMAIV